jgi:hypothetical protein
MAEKGEIPEWQIFDKKVIDELETLYLEQSDNLKRVSANAKEAWFMGLMSFAIATRSMKYSHPNYRRDIEGLKPFIKNRKINSKVKELMIRLMEAAVK